MKEKVGYLKKVDLVWLRVGRWAISILFDQCSQTTSTSKSAHGWNLPSRISKVLLAPLFHFQQEFKRWYVHIRCFPTNFASAIGAMPQLPQFFRIFGGFQTPKAVGPPKHAVPGPEVSRPPVPRDTSRQAPVKHPRVVGISGSLWGYENWESRNVCTKFTIWGWNVTHPCAVYICMYNYVYIYIFISYITYYESYMG